jgi:hypothetical protein
MDTELNYKCTKDFHPLCKFTVTTTVPAKWLGLIRERYILPRRHKPDNMADGHRPLYCFVAAFILRDQDKPAACP